MKRFTHTFITLIILLSIGSCSNPTSSESDAESCNFNAKITGDFSGEFDGPARLRFGNDGSVGIDLQSRAYVNGLQNTGNFVANTGAIADQDSGGNIIINEYQATGASAVQFDVFSATYLAGFDEADCDQCGGFFRINSISDLGDNEKSMSGEFDITLPVSEPQPDPDEPLIIHLSGTFTAVTGSSSDPNSPFSQCRITYAED